MPKKGWSKKTVKPHRKTPKRTHVEVYLKGGKLLSKGKASTPTIAKTIKKVLELDINPFKRKRRGH